MTWDERNLANTVHAYRRTLPCAVARPQKYPPHFDPRATTNYHEWRGGDRCVWCHKTRAQVREPKPITLHQALKGN